MQNKRILKNYFYNSFYQILLIIIPLITTPYISRVLGAEKIGLYSYSYSIAYYFVMFIMLGLNNYGNRTIAFVRDDKEKLSKVFCEIYFMQLCVSIVLILLYIMYAAIFSNNIITWIMLIYVVSAALDINWFFFGVEQFKIISIRSSIIKLLSTVVIFLIVKNPNDIYTYSLINVVSIILSQAILWLYIRKFVSYTKVTKNGVLAHLKPNLLLFIPVIAISIYKMMDKIMIGSLSNLEQVGYYDNVEKIVQVPLALITSLGTVMMPKISNLISKKDEKKSKIYFTKSLYFAALISSSMCFGIMAIAKNFVPWYYGNNYEPCILLFQILMPSCIFLSIANVIRTQYLIPYKCDRIYIVSVISGAVMNLIINGILIPKIGAAGAAIGTLIAEGIVCIMQIILVKNKLNIYRDLLKCLKYIVFGVVMYIILLLLPDFSEVSLYNIIVKIIIGTVIYIILSFSFIKKELLQKSI